ncbi:hypothetical protein YC2023_089468 [Brassica napus]
MSYTIFRGRVMTTRHASCGIIKIWQGSCFREGVCRTKVDLKIIRYSLTYFFAIMKICKLFSVFEKNVILYE